MPKPKLLALLALVWFLLLPLRLSSQAAPPPRRSPAPEKSIGVLIGLVRLEDPTAYRASARDKEERLPWAPVEASEGSEEGQKYERADDSEFDSPYETVWLSDSAAGVTVRPLQDVIVPHKDTFWRIGTNASRLRNSGGGSARSEEFVWAAPIGYIPQLEGVDRINCVDERTSVVLDYVGPAYYALTSFSEATCAHYDESHSFAVLPFDTGVPEARETEVGTLLGPKADAAWKRVAAGVAPTGKEPEQSDLDADPCDADGYTGQPTDWTLRHSQGAWHAMAKFHGAGGGICGRWEVNEALKAPLPSSLVGRNTLPVPWKQLLRRFPTILDAFSAPQGDYLVIVADRQLTLVTVRDGQIGSIRAIVGIPHGRVIMAEWALGPHVAVWDRQLATLPTPSAAASSASDIRD